MEEEKQSEQTLKVERQAQQQITVKTSFQSDTTTNTHKNTPLDHLIQDSEKFEKNRNQQKENKRVATLDKGKPEAQTPVNVRPNDFENEELENTQPLSNIKMKNVNTDPVPQIKNKLDKPQHQKIKKEHLDKFSSKLKKFTDDPYDEVSYKRKPTQGGDSAQKDKETDFSKVPQKAEQKKIESS